MDEALFFRTELSGEAVPVTEGEIKTLRRLILEFYEDNLAEPVNIMVTGEALQFEFWKYLSIFFETEWAESKRIAWIIERGCLALINGQTLDLLGDVIWPGTEGNDWGWVKAIPNDAIPYVEAYQPTDPSLREGKAMLLETLRFMRDITPADLDSENYAERDSHKQGYWFVRNIVADFYRTTVESEFGC